MLKAFTGGPGWSHSSRSVDEIRCHKSNLQYFHSPTRNEIWKLIWSCISRKLFYHSTKVCVYHQGVYNQTQDNFFKDNITATVRWSILCRLIFSFSFLQINQVLSKCINSKIIIGSLLTVTKSPLLLSAHVEVIKLEFENSTFQMCPLKVIT